LYFFRADSLAWGSAYYFLSAVWISSSGHFYIFENVNL
jgi:hypothetical protein